MNKFECAVNATQHGFNITSCELVVKSYMFLYKSLAMVMAFVIGFYMILRAIDWIKRTEIKW